MGELIFGKYEIRRRLAIGGMGEVFEAVQRAEVKGFERTVILKNLLPEFARQDSYVEGFLDEARVAATLNHPNVVSIYEVGQWNGVYFIAMEHIRGRDLAQLVRASLKVDLPIPPAVIARIIRDAALGLDHAHRAKDAAGKPLHVVHRDVSPQNIMVREDGVTKVVDFGIAWAMNRTTRTQTGAVKGKLAYMAPEQVDSRNVTGLADQFALGVVLWELCTRRRLFKAEHDYELVKLVMEGEVVPPSSLCPGLPRSLDEVALQMVQRDPKRRFPSCAEVSAALDAVLLECSQPSSVSPVATYVRELSAREPLEPAAPVGENFVMALRDGAAATTPDRPARLATAPRSRRSAVWLVPLVLLALAGAGELLFGRSEPVKPAPQPAPRVPVVEPPAPAAPANATLVITTRPSAARVRVDGQSRGAAPVEVEVPAGAKVLVSAERDGFIAAELFVDARPGERQPVLLELTAVKPKPAPAAPPARPPATGGTGFFSLETTPYTNVTIDGQRAGETPLAEIPLSVGRHRVEMVTEAGEKVTREVDIAPGKTTGLRLAVP